MPVYGLLLLQIPLKVFGLSCYKAKVLSCEFLAVGPCNAQGRGNYISDLTAIELESTPLPLDPTFNAVISFPFTQKLFIVELDQKGLKNILTLLWSEIAILDCDIFGRYAISKMIGVAEVSNSTYECDSAQQYQMTSSGLLSRSRSLHSIQELVTELAR